MAFDIGSILTRLRMLGSDDASVETKRAVGGLPDSYPASVCAFANRPGGGLVLLGIDEALGFRPVSVDAHGLARRSADVARQRLDPPPRLEISVVPVERHMVVAVDVAELPPGTKPCRIRSGAEQGVWIRAFDGDYRASDLEAQALYASRVAPHDDRAPVPDATRADLDPDDVTAFINARRRAARAGSRLRTMTDDEVLHTTSVLVDNQPTIAALLLLGTHPQRLFPGLHIRAVVSPTGGSDGGLRAGDAPRIDGPIPDMIAATVDWVHQTSGVAIRDLGAGRVVDEPHWPLDAVRELVANALLHRDLSWSVNEPVTLTVTPTRLVIRNPGGLYGITVDELGRPGITPARNATLIAIASHVTLPDGSRTVEQLASGIPTIRAALEQRRYPPPRFIDDAVRFTVVATDGVAPRSRLTPAAYAILETVGDQILTVADLASITNRSEQVVGRDLRRLVGAGLITVDGGRGRHTTYRRTRHF